MEISLLQQIKECNGSYRSGQPHPLDSAGAPFIVLACIDPRLTGLLEPALGLPRHRALVIRVAGNLISESAPEALRSIATGAYIKGGTELFVVGHTDCAMAAFSSAQVVENFRKAGVARNAFGDQDLRAWFGAFPDIRGNVLSGIAYVRRSGILAPQFKVHGLILGTDDGTLDVIHDGDASAPVAAPVVPGGLGREAEIRQASEQTQERRVPETPPLPVPHPQHGTKPVIIGAPRPVSPGQPPGSAPVSVAAAAMVLRDFFLKEGRDAHFQQTALDLKTLVKHERNPARIISVLERIARDYRTRYPELPATLEYLKQTLPTEGSSGMQFMEFIRRILD